MRFHHFNHGSAKHTHKHKERINASNSGMSFWQAATQILLSLPPAKNSKRSTPGVNT